MDISEYLKSTIKDTIINARGVNCWIGHGIIISEIIDRLQPNTPIDETSGFIAYNVNSKRMKIRTSRFLGKKLNLNSGFLSEKVLQTMTERINTELFPDLEIRIDRGKNITNNYDNAIGGSSCMTDSSSCYTRMYEYNPQTYKQLIMQTRKNSARAILITLDNGSILMDRIYTDSSYLKEKMIDYAIKNNWYYRSSTSPGSYDIEFYKIPLESSEYAKMFVTGIVYTESEVPYADTLTQYCNCNSRLIISHPRALQCCDGELDSTSGYLENEDRSCCDNCGDMTDDDDLNCINDDYICSCCYNEHYFYCEHCQESYSNDDVVYIDSESRDICQSCADNDYFYCDDCNEYFHSAKANQTQSDTYVCDSCLSSNYTECKDCEEYAPDDETTDDICNNCIENYTECTNCTKTMPIDDIQYSKNDDPYCKFCINYCLEKKDND